MCCWQPSVLGCSQEVQKELEKFEKSHTVHTLWMHGPGIICEFISNSTSSAIQIIETMILWFNYFLYQPERWIANLEETIKTIFQPFSATVETWIISYAGNTWNLQKLWKMTRKKNDRYRKLQHVKLWMQHENEPILLVNDLFKKKLLNPVG